MTSAQAATSATVPTVKPLALALARDSLVEEADSHIDSAVFQVESMSVALRAVSNNAYLLPSD